ncbi:hypothetical protein ACM55K_04635 [Flavobacterium sp. LT1R49]
MKNNIVFLPERAAKGSSFQAIENKLFSLTDYFTYFLFLFEFSELRL